MNISGLLGMILSIVISFSTAVVCQDQKWTEYHYHPSTTLWPGQDKNADTSQDLQMQSSIRRSSSYSTIGQKWTEYNYHPPTTLWPGQNKHADPSQDLQMQSSIRRPSSYSPMGKIRWQNPNSKPQWQAMMKWQDPFSKPRWQVSKAHNLKPFSKQPFKIRNDLNGGGWSSPKQWQSTLHSNLRTTPSARYASRGTWPDYIPPLSVIRPSMDDPHALLGL